MYMENVMTQIQQNDSSVWDSFVKASDKEILAKLQKVIMSDDDSLTEFKINLAYIRLLMNGVENSPIFEGKNSSIPPIIVKDKQLKLFHYT